MICRMTLFFAVENLIAAKDRKILYDQRLI